MGQRGEAVGLQEGSVGDRKQRQGTLRDNTQSSCKQANIF